MLGNLDPVVRLADIVDLHQTIVHMTVLKVRSRQYRGESRRAIGRRLPSATELGPRSHHR